jgi:serine/threonine protein kinase
MEYVRAVNLDELMKALTPERRVEVACGFMCQVLDALAYAHKLGFVHGDVKPRNILVAKYENHLRVKLADFGLAKNYFFSGLSPLTKEGEIHGAPAFMPREQWMDSKYMKPPADIFAVGATLYWFLTGRTPDFALRPPDPMHDEAISLQHADNPAFRFIPIGVLEILSQAMAWDPNDRFPMAEAMRAELLPYARPQRR